MNATFAEALRFGGHYGEAIEYYRRAIDLEPDAGVWHSLLGRTYTENGMYREALAEFDTAAHLPGGEGRNQNLSQRAYIAARTGRKAEAIAIIRRLEEERSQGRVGPNALPLPYLGLGDRDKAFELLDQAVETRTMVPGRFFQKQLGSDPRFDQLLRKAGVKK